MTAMELKITKGDLVVNPKAWDIVKNLNGADLLLMTRKLFTSTGKKNTSNNPAKRHVPFVPCVTSLIISDLTY